MSLLLNHSEKYFGTRDIYKIFNLKKDSSQQDVKKAYYQLSLQIHPDRVSEHEKKVATEKFKILTKLNDVLSDSNKKMLYDERGTINENNESDFAYRVELWQQSLRSVTTTDMENNMTNYAGSEAQKRDIRESYLSGNGCMKFILNHVPFVSLDDEYWIIELVNDWIASGEVPKLKLFTQKAKKEIKDHSEQNLDDIQKLKRKNLSNRNLGTLKKKKSAAKRAPYKVKNGRISKKN